ncbi:hypothetical protein A6A06_20725 [Streptomyces sp. CB02923]|uniref:hypothetical protein n=1 Tax=Streptomyces sp. CB02923 TaxID=1718985 RepID=UPI000939F1D1|nr:hypothetical protein [Streptomyces sp. CB02923]OKI01235.1 hypothetical protein A6A06_20725 [Streptomyces sp. CB02923]
MSATDAPVHQIVFRWDADHAVGGAGVGPVAWSGNREGLQPIYRKVAALLSVPGDEARESLARVELPGEPGQERSVLLIRRIPGQDRGGRPSTCSHALLGSASVLTPRRCLGLHTWRWEGSDINLREVEGRSLDCVPAQALRDAAESAAPGLTDRTGQFPGELAAVLAGRLREPRQRLSVLDRTGGDGPVHVLWGMCNLIGPALPSWSFATHDTRDGGPFRYVFVPRWPVSATRDQQLTRLDPARPGSAGDGRDDGVPDHGDPAGEAAARLADHFLDVRFDLEALRETRRALAERHVFGEEPLDERARLVHEALKWLSHAGSHRRTRTDRAGEPREPARDPVYDRARDERLDNPAYDNATYDNAVFDNMRQDQEQPAHRRTPDQDRQAPDQPREDRDGPAYDVRYEDRDGPAYDVRYEDRGGPAYDVRSGERGGQSHAARREDRGGQAVRADSGFARDVTALVLRQALHRNGAETEDYLRTSSDSVLLEVLEGGLPADQADHVAHVLILRAPHRSPSAAEEVGERLLRAHLFLGPYGEHRDEDPVTGPDGRMRVQTAVYLYGGLVQPHSDEGSIPGLLWRVLPDLWNGHHGRGRAVLRQLLGDGRPTGFGDQGWKALFEAATRTTATAEQPGVLRFAGRGTGRAPWLPGRRPRGGRPESGLPDHDERSAGWVWVSVLLLVIAVAVILIPVILLMGS